MPSFPATSHLAIALQDIHADVWHAHTLAGSPVQVVATGDALLDAQLPGRGWPVGALTEILQPNAVHSEWRLLLSALARCGHGPVVLVGAPYVPFVPALQVQGLHVHRLLWVAAQEPAARLWAAEQALRCAEVDAVLAWLPQARSAQLRRLHIAAAEHQKLLFVMRPAHVRNEASPAGLRLYVAPCEAHTMEGDGLLVEVFKRKGPPQEHSLWLQAQSASMVVLLHASAPGSRYALDRTAA